MAVAFQSVQTASAVSPNGSIAITKPVSLAVGDLMLAGVSGLGSSSVNAAPTGWTTLQNQGSNSVITTTFYKIATSTDVAATNFTFTNSANGGLLGFVARFTGTNLGIDQINSVEQTAITTITSGGITPVIANSMFVMVASQFTNAATITFGSYAVVTDNPVWTEATDAEITATGTSHIGIAMAYGSRSQVTASGNATVLASGAMDNGKLQIFNIVEFSASPRYWVGGNGTWDASSTTHWSATSGGSSGASYPNYVTTDVIFDGSSGAGTATITTGVMGGNLTFTGYTGTFAGSSNITIPGSLTLVSGMTFSYNGNITFSAISNGKTITTASKTLAGMTFDGVGGGWTFQDTVTTSGAGFIILTNGSLNFGNQNVTTARITSNNTNTRILTLGSGTITLSSTGTVWSFATSSGLTLATNTSTIKLTDTTSSSKTFAGGSLTYNNVWFTGSGTGTFIITGSNTFNDFKCDTPPHTINFTAGITTYVTTFTVNGTAGNLMTLQSTSAGSQWYLISSTAVVCDYLSLKDSWASKPS